MKTHEITKNSPATVVKSVGTDSQIKSWINGPKNGWTVEQLTERYQASFGKSIVNTLAFARVIDAAHFSLPDVKDYRKWLIEIAKMSTASASRYRTISECEVFYDEKNHHLLTPEYAKLYQIASISNHAKYRNTEDKGRAVIMETLEWLNTPVTETKTKTDKETGKKTKFTITKFPTYKELADKVRELLDKQPSGTLHRFGPVVINTEDDVNQAILEKAKEVKAKAKMIETESKAKVKLAEKEAKAQVKAAQVKAELAERTTADLQRKLAEAAKELGAVHAPPTGKKGMEKAGTSFKTDNNTVKFEGFGGVAFKKMESNLQYDIMWSLHEAKLTNIEVTVTQLKGALIAA